MSGIIHVGLEGFTFPDLDAFGVVDLAARTRYTHAGVRLVDPATNTPTLSVGEAHRLREHAHERGITLYGADIVDLEGPDDTRAEFLAVLAASGVSRLSVFHRGTDLTSAGRRFGDLVSRAREYGVTPHLEPVSYFGVNSIATAGELVADADGGGITIDTLHFGRLGDDLDRLAELARSVPIWLQVCDGPTLDEVVPVDASQDERLAALRHESVAGRMPPGAGVCGVGDIVRTVRDAAPHADLVLMVEAPDHERVRRIGASTYAAVCRNATDEVIVQSASPEVRT